MLLYFLRLCGLALFIWFDIHTWAEHADMEETSGKDPQSFRGHHPQQALAEGCRRSVAIFYTYTIHN